MKVPFDMTERLPLPLVSVIMPTANRPHLFVRGFWQYVAQDYPNKELIVAIDKGKTFPNAIQQVAAYKDVKIVFCDNPIIGAKRNKAIEKAQGDIIIHADDDDFYASDWITRSVSHLINSGAQMTGLSSAYLFKSPNSACKYTHNIKLPPQKPYVLGATMCFLKSYWEQNKFREIQTGEDYHFSMECPKLIPHDYKEGFVAMLHGANTASGKNLNKPEFKPIDANIVKSILGTELEKYVTLQPKTS